MQLFDEARHGCAIVGPTASGKTALSTRLARRWGESELISVDAMAVYRGLDIGTAKPDAEQRRGLSWHLIDVVDPSEDFSVATFQTLAEQALSVVERNGHRPILVGGTGLYHRAVIDHLEIPAQYPNVVSQLNARAESEGLASLYAELVIADPLAASRIEPTNTRRIVRALEVCVGSGRPFSSFGPGLTNYEQSNYLLIGLDLPKETLHARIEARLDQQFEQGFLKDLLAQKTPISKTARQALGYRELIEHLELGTPLSVARATILQRTKNFARRQLAWFRRDPRIVWLDAEASDLDDEITNRLFAMSDGESPASVSLPSSMDMGD
jgi:tRNA dimethylallyltransferase